MRTRTRSGYQVAKAQVTLNLGRLIVVCVLAAFALAAVTWLALLILGPTLPVPLAGALYALGSHICHQRPERSFHLFAAQLPVCARCLGIYAGAAADRC